MLPTGSPPITLTGSRQSPCPHQGPREVKCSTVTPSRIDNRDEIHLGVLHQDRGPVASAVSLWRNGRNENIDKG